MSGPESGHTNQLIDETSPYLLQHAHNPVAWYPWGPEALEKSRDENKPILLSIGYSACHWCHVMERESFENEEIASLMNEHFIPIKVDREERPDVDEIYMNAVQMMTGSGGWPLTVFLTPTLKPFYGGTYFPPDDRFGRPGFKTVLIELARVFSEEKARIQEASETLTERLQSLSITSRSTQSLSRDVVGLAAQELSARFDRREGGFSPAPKFPPSGSLSLLLREYRVRQDPEHLEMVELTLDKMASGGMYDQLGGGFHRYSTDAHWLVPHFEKMLYDNALLVPVYLEAHQLTRNPGYARIARETLDWVVREMQADSGGYYSTQDADSEGVEGKFYVWSKKEVDAVVGELAEAFDPSYDVTVSGNWEGSNILHLPGGLASWSAEHDTARRALLGAREQRIHPSLDDKVLTSWNGLMIVAMSRGFRILGDERFLESARRAAGFIESTLYDGDRLLATYRSGRAKLNAYLDDHAFLLAGYVELFACDFDTHWLDQAKRLAAALGELFVDASSGGFFFTGKDHETLIARTKSGYDGAIPSGNAMAASALLKLAELTGDNAYEDLAVETLHTFQLQMERSPSGFAQMLAALDFYLADRRQVVVVGREDARAVREAMSQLWSVYAPNVSIARLDAGAEPAEHIPMFEGKTPGDDPDEPYLYLCENYACEAPSDDVKRVISALEG